jgi:hypothetical protein
VEARTEQERQQLERLVLLGMAQAATQAAVAAMVVAAMRGKTLEPLLSQ